MMYAPMVSIYMGQLSPNFLLIVITAGDLGSAVLKICQHALKSPVCRQLQISSADQCNFQPSEIKAL